MIILDTHAWIFLASDQRRLSAAARRAVDSATTLGVSPISAWEIATKVARGHLCLDREVDVWVRQALALDRVVVAALTPEVAMAAGALGAEGFHGDPADRMIAATAMASGVALVTKDRRIRAFRRVRTIW